MEELMNIDNISTPEDVIEYMKLGISVRKKNPDKSREIARLIFNNTHELITGVALPDDITRIRYEFGALEAPGNPNYAIDLKDYDDKLWSRLEELIKNRTV